MQVAATRPPCRFRLATEEALMVKRSGRLFIGFCGAAVLLVGLTATAASASPGLGFPPGPQSTAYVAPGAPAGHGFGCANAGFSTISAAVAAANPGSTIIVCPG